MYWVEYPFDRLNELELGCVIRVSPERPERGMWQEVQGRIVRKEITKKWAENEYPVLVIEFANGVEHEILLHPDFHPDRNEKKCYYDVQCT